MTTRPTQPTAPVYNVKTLVPAAWGRRLSHLSANLGVPKHVLIADGLLLLFKLHDIAEGLPEPTPPLNAEMTGTGGDR